MEHPQLKLVNKHIYYKVNLNNLADKFSNILIDMDFQRKYFLIILLSLVSIFLHAQDHSTIKLTDDIELVKLTKNVYQHISYYTSPQYGRFPSNGLIYILGDKAFLFDTPMSNELTKILVNYIESDLKKKIIGFIPNQWHDDWIGGLDFINSKNITSYANQMTIDIAKQKNLPLPQFGFNDSLILKFDKVRIECFYPGPAHAKDNIVVWLPDEKVLFAGCMCKEMASTGLGNIADADLINWPEAINTLINRYKDVNFVIPGHGKCGGTELLFHTTELLKQNIK